MTNSNPRVALITGATAGIGEAVARKFSENGMQLILAARRREKLEELTNSLGTDCHILELDVSDRAALDKAFNSIPDEFSEIDVLANNAGLALGMESASKADLNDWEEMIDTNIKRA